MSGIDRATHEFSNLGQRLALQLRQYEYLTAVGWQFAQGVGQQHGPF